MKIIFECLGFATNPLFLLDTEDEDARPIPYGVVSAMRVKELEFWPENYDPSVVSESEVIAAYKEQYAKHGVVMNDVSKEAWLEDRFGEPQK